MDDNADAKLVEGKLDLVPMIDCIMLLLLFFILTTTFQPDEKALAALLPAQGPSERPVEMPIPPIAIAIYPDGLGAGGGASEYAAAWSRMSAGSIPTRVAVRIGRNEPVVVDGAALSSHDAETSARELRRIDEWMAAQLDRFEIAGADRIKQTQVEVHCFSGLEWKHALVVYDAVRAFERARTGRPVAAVRDDLSDARVVSMSAPLMRGATAHELGTELAEIMNLH